MKYFGCIILTRSVLHSFLHQKSFLSKVIDCYKNIFGLFCANGADMKAIPMLYLTRKDCFLFKRKYRWILRITKARVCGLRFDWKCVVKIQDWNSIFILSNMVLRYFHFMKMNDLELQCKGVKRSIMINEMTSDSVRFCTILFIRKLGLLNREQ